MVHARQFCRNSVGLDVNRSAVQDATAFNPICVSSWGGDEVAVKPAPGAEGSDTPFDVRCVPLGWDATRSDQEGSSLDTHPSGKAPVHAVRVQQEPKFASRERRGHSAGRDASGQNSAQAHRVISGSGSGDEGSSNVVDPFCRPVHASLRQRFGAMQAPPPPRASQSSEQVRPRGK